MGQTWILDVLADLRRFAEENGMTALARDIATAEGTARSDILLRTGDAVMGVAGNDGAYIAGGPGSRANAKPALRAVAGARGAGAGQ